MPFVDVSSRSIFFYPPPLFLGLLGRGKKFVFSNSNLFFCRINNKIEGGDWEQTIGYTHTCVCVAMEFVFPKVGGFFKKFKFFRFRFSANAEETLAGIFFSCFIESY